MEQDCGIDKYEWMTDNNGKHIVVNDSGCAFLCVELANMLLKSRGDRFMKIHSTECKYNDVGNEYYIDVSMDSIGRVYMPCKHIITTLSQPSTAGLPTEPIPKARGRTGKAPTLKNYQIRINNEINKLGFFCVQTTPNPNSKYNRNIVVMSENDTANVTANLTRNNNMSAKVNQQGEIYYEFRLSGGRNVRLYQDSRSAVMNGMIQLGGTIVFIGTLNKPSYRIYAQMLMGNPRMATGRIIMPGVVMGNATVLQHAKVGSPKFAGIAYYDGKWNVYLENIKTSVYGALHDSQDTCPRKLTIKRTTVNDILDGKSMVIDVGKFWATSIQSLQGSISIVGMNNMVFLSVVFVVY